MKLGFIILAHKNPSQLDRLLNSLDEENICCYIHIDLKCDIREFISATAKERRAKVVFLNNRFDGRWGGLGIVLATLEGIRTAVAESDITHISLLSGQDYPILPVKYFFSFLNKHQSSNFIEFTEFNEINWPNQLDRIRSYNFRLFGRQYTFPYSGALSARQKLLYQCFNIYFKRPRLIPFNFVPFYGSQWWTLTLESCKEIIEFIDNNPCYTRYHRYSFLPDEFFFQTILLNITHFNKEIFINNNLRFIKWEKGNPHPTVLTSSSLEEIKASGKFFARKFDCDVDAEVIAKLI